MFVLLILIGGDISFTGLGQLELPEFTIKNALVITAYPGASAMQVEEEVMLVLEDAIQNMPQVKHITSINNAGVSFKPGVNVIDVGRLIAEKLIQMETCLPVSYAFLYRIPNPS